ncbi:MAG: GerMN domain-containing protein [Spirochaetia bacterium]|nr:GerMN domain-containing protein [Spirochaetia bacterium]
MAKKKKASLGCLFWVALILLVLVVFLFNRERINTVLDETGFREYLFTQKTQEPEVQRVEPEAEQPSTPEAEQQDNSTRSGDQPETPRPKDEEESKDEEEQQVEIKVDTPEEDESASSDSSTEGSEKPRIDKRMRKSALYFVEITDSGSIKLQRIVRPIYYNDSPLTETLQTLLEGLTADELNQGLLNLIPQDSRIRKVWVEDSTAYIDFNEAIRFNQFGTEGLHTQLRQLVYTATEFQTVDSVQILINGNKIDYLASEGIFVGKPLTREDVARTPGE